jgi:hypothetical protein
MHLSWLSAGTEERPYQIRALQLVYFREKYVMKRKGILAGAFALAIGLSMALPMRAAADQWDHGNHNRGHQYQSWRWEHDHDHYRGYPYTPPPAYANSYQRRYQYLPQNGQGMINPRNSNLYWACDSDGHHCHWAPRY